MKEKIIFISPKEHWKFCIYGIKRGKSFAFVGIISKSEKKAHIVMEFFLICLDRVLTELIKVFANVRTKNPTIVNASRENGRSYLLHILSLIGYNSIVRIQDCILYRAVIDSCSEIQSETFFGEI